MCSVYLTIARRKLLDIFCPRGAYLINSNLRKEIKRRHEEEQQTVDKIRRSMTKIRHRQRTTAGHSGVQSQLASQQWVPETHNQGQLMILSSFKFTNQ